MKIDQVKEARRASRAILSETMRGRKGGRHSDKRKPFAVTDDELDAPDGAVVNGYVRIGCTWHPVEP